MSNFPDVPPILLVDLAKRYGGADVRVLQMARAFHDLGLDYHVATLEGSDLHGRLSQSDLKYLAIPYGRSDPRTALFIRQFVHQQGIKIIDAHNPQSQLWAQLSTTGDNRVRHISTMNSSYRLEHDGSLKGYAYEQIITFNRIQNSYFVAVSEAIRDYLIQTVKIPAERVRIIPSSIDIPATPPAHHHHPLFAEWGWSEAVQVVIAVGRLETVKGHRYLIDALAQVHPQYPNLRAVIVGEGRIQADLAAQIAQLGLGEVVKLAGFRTDVPDLLRSSDFYAMPSLSEGLPYALLEAGTFNLPVIVSDVGGMASLLDHMQTGYLFPVEDVGRLADGIAWLLDHSEAAQQLSANFSQLIHDHYSIHSLVEKTMAIYTA